MILFFTGIALMINSVRLVIAGIEGAELPEPSWVALGVALISIIAKEALYRYTVIKGKKLRSDALTANAWHHRSDAFSSVGTLVGIAGAMFLGERWRILDPVAAGVVSFFIIKAGVDIIRPALDELLEGSLPKDQTEELGRIIKREPGVEDFHNLRSRKVGNAIAVDVHIKMDGDMSLRAAHDIASRIENGIRQKFGTSSMVYIHMEPSKK